MPSRKHPSSILRLSPSVLARKLNTKPWVNIPMLIHSSLCSLVLFPLLVQHLHLHVFPCFLLVYNVGPVITVNHYFLEQGLYFPAQVSEIWSWLLLWRWWVVAGLHPEGHKQYLVSCLLYMGPLNLCRVSRQLGMLSFSKEDETASASVESSGKSESNSHSSTQMSIFQVSGWHCFLPGP